ncbi:DUF4229 domain-containing protein [Micrococcoides hystricis]|uniref:DUF4229 domain-containing protein n=1 Tax=Micrococcoides hystricis TaxID=1572761 RepID=A0ABV6P9C7_9MICC
MPVLKYFLIRFALFAVIFVAAVYLRAGWILATIAAVIGAMAIGYLAFPKQRQAAATYAASKMNRGTSSKSGADEAAEDSLEER